MNTKKENNLWKSVLQGAKIKKDKNCVFTSYRVYLKSGDFIINTTDRNFENIEYDDGILKVKGHIYPKSTRLTHLNEIEMSQIAPYKYFIPIENADMIATL